ncbi:MAG: hypothetical protein AB7N71_08420 [Phycisphaerae bacterium]
MNRRFASFDARYVLVGCFVMALGSHASAHVDLDSPNGGESFEVGSNVTVHWHVAIQHNTQNWDLWYSTTGPVGPWIEIASDLPAGNTAAGAMHAFNWTVPNDPSAVAWVRVRQDNGGEDYFDISNLPFSIVANSLVGDMNCDGLLSVSDIAGFVLALTEPAEYAIQFPACDISAGDLNEDSQVSVGDIGLFVALLTGL